MGGTRDRTDLKVLVSRSAGTASALNLALCICEHDSPPPRIRRFTFWHHRRRTTRWARDFFFDWLKRKPEKGTSGPPLPKPRRLLCGLYFGTRRSPCVRKPKKFNVKRLKPTTTNSFWSWTLFLLELYDSHSTNKKPCLQHPKNTKRGMKIILIFIGNFTNSAENTLYIICLRIRAIVYREFIIYS
jgi:hypothetical protein